MALSVNTNVTSQTVQKNLNKAGDSLSTSMTRLSSGLKINSAKDDAAGMQIANRLTSQTKGMTVAIANANNGTSIAQTAEGAMQESTNILQRLRELALQSANGDKSDADRSALQQEFTAKTGELTRIAQTTTFGGRNILDGSFQNVGFQIGADANQTISFGMSDISATGLKGSYSEASVSGTVATQLQASVTGSPAVLTGGTAAGTTTTPYSNTATMAATLGAAETIKINNVDVVLTGGEDLAGVVGKIEDKVPNLASEVGGKLVLSSSSAITIEGTGTLATALKAGADPAGGTSTPSAAVPGLDAATSIKINGKTVNFLANASLDDIKAAIDTANTAANPDGKTGVSAEVVDGRLKLKTTDGSAIKLENGSNGSLAKLGLSSGSTAAKLENATSISLNGTEVKFTAGSSMADVVSSINSASTGVTASLDKDGSLKLFSTADISVANGSAGTGLAALGLTAAAAVGAGNDVGTTKAVKMESTVSELSILSAADSQRTVQALADAIQQIDTQRSALGAVQNRFTSTVANLQSISENSTAALGRVQDTDFASEAAELTKQQTLQQASTAILSQANQLPSAVMKLLQ